MALCRTQVTYVICAKNDYLAVIATSWIGGDTTSNLLVDFRTDTPKINTIEFGLSCVDAILTLVDGTIVARDWNDEFGIINTDNFSVEEIKDVKIL